MFLLALIAGLVAAWAARQAFTVAGVGSDFHTNIIRAGLCGANGGVGAVWSSKSMEGDPIKVTVVRGIQKPAP